MSLSFARLLGACVALACLSLVPARDVEAHNDDAYHYHHGDLPSQVRWMATLHDDTALRYISMPGTHGSAARYGGWATENQRLTIRQQLDAGIRFLDLRTRHYYNTLELHHGPMYQYQNFGDALDQIVAFLQQHPTETVLIRVKEEHTEEGNWRSFPATVNSYHNKYGRHFQADAHWDMPLRELRGRIVMIKEFAGETPFGNLDFNWDLVRQDDYHLGSNWDLHAKWEKVKHTINLANTSGPVLVPFINFLSGSGGAFPWFVASGHSSPETGAPGLSTGLTTPGFNGWYPDFPRGGCFIGICTIFFEGTNTLAKNHLRNADVRYAGIIAADFPGSGLIQSVIDVNRTRRPIANAGTGKCLDVEGGVGPGRLLISWDCHGENHQRFTVRGEHIRVGGMCLGVQGASNVSAARVIAGVCHDFPHQRWKLEENGTIRSLLPGVKRCLDINVGHGNRVGLWGCAPNTTEQLFRTRVNDGGFVVVGAGTGGGTVSPPGIGGGTVSPPSVGGGAGVGAAAGVGPRANVRVRVGAGVR